MKSFWITIKGAPEQRISDRFWCDIAKYGVNFTVLDTRSFIYGKANDCVIDRITAMAANLGFEIVVERGC